MHTSSHWIYIQNVSLCIIKHDCSYLCIWFALLCCTYYTSGSMPLTRLIDIACFSTYTHCYALRDQTFTHAEDKHIHKRCVCHEPLVICPDGLSLSCQDKACCPLMVMPSARWRIVFLFKQTRGSVIHFLHRSWHEHAEVYSHDPPRSSSSVQVSHSGHRRNISLSLSLSCSV